MITFKCEKGTGVVCLTPEPDNEMDKRFLDALIVALLIVQEGIPSGEYRDGDGKLLVTKL